MSPIVSGRFSVIIPTLQRSQDLARLVEVCAHHDLVHEIVLINNAQEPLNVPASPKVRVLNQMRNIYVNPAWNLGVRESTAEWVAILNDDIRFEPDVFTYVAGVLRKGWFGIIGPDKTCFVDDGDRPISHRLATPDTITFGFGAFMCMRRADYVPIPEEMIIWGGDDWLFAHQRKLNAVLVHTPFRTQGSVTAGSEEFRGLKAEQQEVCRRILAPIHGTRWWHRPIKTLAWARTLRHRLRRR
ncbi:glycosyltransferase [Tessaracoccus sp. Y1736]